MKHHKLLIVFLALCLLLLPAAVCPIIRPDGCPNGLYLSIESGQRICRVSGAATDPTSISPGFGTLGKLLGQ